MLSIIIMVTHPRIKETFIYDLYGEYIVSSAKIDKLQRIKKNK
jgi:hypothetical protein